MKTSYLIITALGVAVSANALAEDTNWVDKQHQNVQNKLHHWSNGIHVHNVSLSERRKINSKRV